MFRESENNLIKNLDSRGNLVTGDYYIGEEKFDNKIAKGWNDVRPKYGQFLKKETSKGLYDKEEIEKDRQLVKQIKQEDWFIQERNKEAIALEYLVMEGIHNNGWLGNEASVTPTLSYDDIVNGVDMVVRFDSKNNEPLFLGIDTTSSLDKTIIDKKIDRSAYNLQRGTLNEIKYFIDDQTNEIKKLEAPRVIVAVPKEEIKLLTDEVLKNKLALEKNSIQLDILEEIINQLKLALEILENKPDKFKLKDYYQKLLDYLEKIEKEKSLSRSLKLGKASKVINDSLARYHTRFSSIAI